MKQKGKNKTYRSPISFFQSKTPPWLLFLTYADFTSTITYQINGKLRASKSIRTGKGQNSSWERKEEILGKKVLLKPYFWSTTTHQPWRDSLTNSTTPAVTTRDVPLTLQRSQGHAESCQAGDSPAVNVPCTPTSCRLQLRFPSLGNAIEQPAPPSPLSILPINICTAGGVICHLPGVT